MKNKVKIDDFVRFSSERLIRMKEAVLIALESSCSNKQFLEYCNRLDCISYELESRENRIEVNIKRD